MSAAPSDDGEAVERIIRRAEALGYDAERVALALGQPRPRPTEYQTVEEVRSQSWFTWPSRSRPARPS
jgi:hypothetical protein